MFMPYLEGVPLGLYSLLFWGEGCLYFECPSAQKDKLKKKIMERAEENKQISIQHLCLHKRHLFCLVTLPTVGTVQLNNL